MDRTRQAALAKAQKELQALINKAQEQVETERFRIAKELHDDIGQQITLLSFLLHRIKQTAGEKATDELKQAQEISTKLIGKVREISLQLRPALLDNAGLLPTLQNYLEDLSSRTGIHFNLKHSGLDKELPKHIATAVYRTVEEAANNVARHARAAHFDVIVNAGKRTLTMEIRDGGIGFNPAEISETAAGLRTIRERTQILGGSYKLESAPGKGTRLTVKLPLKA